MAEYIRGVDGFGWLLQQATYPWGGQRFFPIGQHPAAFRDREQLRRIGELNDLAPSRNGEEAIAYYEQHLAQFEAGEDRAKRLHLMARLEPTPSSQREGDDG